MLLQGRNYSRSFAFIRGYFLLLTALLCFVRVAQAEGAKKEVKPLRFVIYGDTRDGHDVHRSIVAQILLLKPDLVLQTGDLVHRGSQEELWKIYDNITGEMRHKIPVYPARGNHDIGGTGYEDRITAPFTSGIKLYYSFDKGGCHFVSMDSFSAYEKGSRQYEWLEKDLAKARKRAKHIFVFFHVPPYSIGSHGSDLEVRRILCPLFTKYGVRIVFNGHDHNFYRTRRDRVTYIVTGGGGAPLYPCDPRKGAIEGDKWEMIHHFILAEVNGDTINLTVYRPDGSSAETFTVRSGE